MKMQFRLSLSSRATRQGFPITKFTNNFIEINRTHDIFPCRTEELCNINSPEPWAHRAHILYTQNYLFIVTLVIIEEVRIINSREFFS